MVSGSKLAMQAGPEYAAGYIRDLWFLSGPNSTTSRGIQLWFYTAYITERIKLPTFIYLLFSAFHHTSFYTKKRLHIRISVYTVRYSGNRYGGRR